ncbi:PREDICTED: uncharacterized protein LOC104756728 [Camelina sativa]|uniref:Uncharacterized protein LOC104756728 n=1 Tax=Camelina sativa TaxID=90675 RepID=A0ABM1R817_CAMSA|nr:PREDICTED: uncharacterized protein LOC104756728 [Camelina sativa]
MSVIPRFSGWINQNIEEPDEVESKSPASNSVWVVDPKYYNVAEVKKESKLWRAAEKKHPWHDAPAKVKVSNKKGLCHMNIEFKLGLPPEAVYEMFTNPNNFPFFEEDKAGRQRLENKSTKVLRKDGPRQTTKVEKALSWNFLGLFSGDIPIHLIIHENHKNLTAKYTTKKMMLMKVFEGSWKVEPDYVDQERLCKTRLPKSREEYKICSGGQGKVGSKVIMEQIFQPSSLLNTPPISGIIRGITIKTTKNLLEDLRKAGITLRKV